MIDQKKNSMIMWALLALSTVGFIDAVYLALKRLVGSPVTCIAFSGCDVVAQSKYSLLLGIPLAFLGVVFYAAMVIMITYYLQRRTKRGLQQVLYLALFGGLFSLYLLALQAFVIKAWCFYCVISDTIGVIGGMLAIYLLRKNK